MEEVTKSGYKLTEVGLIPEDWEVKSLKEISEKIMVGIASAATHAYRKTGVIMFRNQNIKSNYLDDNDILHISPEYEELFKGKRLKSGDLITARTGYPGTTCLIPEKYEGAQSFTTLITRPKKGDLNSNFLCFYINSEVGQFFFDTNQIGGGQKNVNAGTLKNMPIPLPPLPEQTAIANALKDTNDLINNLENLISKKKLIKQGALQELLKPKEGWVICKLEELTKVFTKQTGFDYTTFIKPSLVQIKTDDTIPFIQNKDFFEKWINLDTDYFIPTSMALKFPKILLNEKSLLISISGSVGNVGVYDSKYIAFIGGAVAILKFNDPSLIDWILLFLKSSAGQKLLLNNVKTGSHQNLILEDIRKIEIVFPVKQEQNRIVNIFADLDGEIKVLETSLEKYKTIKQGMMQQLLTGKIRLPH